MIANAVQSANSNGSTLSATDELDALVQRAFARGGTFLDLLWVLAHSPQRDIPGHVLRRLLDAYELTEAVREALHDPVVLEKLDLVRVGRAADTALVEFHFAEPQSLPRATPVGVVRVNLGRIVGFYVGDGHARLRPGDIRLQWFVIAKTVSIRRRELGPNVVVSTPPRSRLQIFLDQFRSLPVMLLGASAVLSLATGGLADAVVIAAVVLANATIGYRTERWAEETIADLLKGDEIMATVVRDGQVQDLPARELVPGDLILLRRGTIVPADGLLLAADSLSVDESALTGESVPVSKPWWSHSTRRSRR